MEAKLIKSNRGKDMLCVNYYTYFRQKVLKCGETFWRCSKKDCKSKVFTVGPENLVTRSEGLHTHEADTKKLNRQIISNSCKRKAGEHMSERPSKIIRQELQNTLPETVTEKDVEYIRKNIYNHRRKFLPGRNPRSAEEVHSVLETFEIKTSKGENFLYINELESGIIVFSCTTNVNMLCKISNIYMDGTFSYCTKYFTQLFTVHGFANGHYIPLLFCLLRDKRAETYKNLFTLLKCKIYSTDTLYFNPEKITIDFEKSIHKAVSEVWPNAKVLGCRFHLHQSWFRKIQNLGLAKEYCDKNSEIGRWLKYCFGLSYLAPEEVGDSFAYDLYSIKPEDERLNKFCDYLLETYIEEGADFPVEIWAESSPSLTRTTNCCESFHSHLNNSFYSTHPSLYTFIDRLKEFQINVYIKIQSVDESKISNNHNNQKLKHLKNLYEQRQLGNINRFHFLKCVSYFSQPVL